MYAAITYLLDSELFTYHNERMVAIMMGDAQENTNPHELYIWYHMILFYGQRHPSLFRSHRRWRKLLPTLGEVVGLEYEEVSLELGRAPECRWRVAFASAPAASTLDHCPGYAPGCSIVAVDC